MMRSTCVDNNFATMIYNKKRYGVVSDRELIVLTSNWLIKKPVAVMLGGKFR